MNTTRRKSEPRQPLCPGQQDAHHVVAEDHRGADKVVRVIIETYLAPNKTFRELKEVLDNEAMNPLLEFSDACRDELMRQRSP
jgi:hypothetical protein